MHDVKPTFSRIINAQDLIRKIEEAAVWAKQERGRTTRYSKLIEEYFAGRGTSPEHVLAYFEAMEVADIYELWKGRVHRYPGLDEKIAEVLASGPLLREDENLLSSSNRSRDDAFTLVMGGRLLASSSDVLAVEGHNRKDVGGHWVGDVTVKQDGAVLDVQCKRPQDASNIETTIKKAKRQILHAAQPKAGIIAIDLSVVLRPARTVLAANGVPSASSKLSTLIDSHHDAVSDIMVGPHIAGILWFGRIPCMVHDPPNVEVFRPYAAGEIAIARNTLSPHAPRLTDIGIRLDSWLKAQSGAEC